jgi:hypothetical protein
MRIPPTVLQSLASSPPSNPDPPGARPYVGHTHFWERAISRRQAIQTAAAGAGLVLGSGLLLPALIEAKGAFVAPRPIPETIFPGAPFHIMFPNTEEPSAIYDFNGFVGATEIQGTGTGGLLFDADMRFMQGTYIGVDGKAHHDTFGFV